MFYSESAGGFYDLEIHGDNIPADAVEITNEEHNALLEGQSHGKIIAADASGHPVLQDPPTPTHDQLVTQTLSLVRSERQPIISILDGLQASALSKADLPTAQTIEVVKQQLRNITKVDLSDCVTADDMRKAVLAAYAAIVAENPSLKLAFKEVTA